MKRAIMILAVGLSLPLFACKPDNGTPTDTGKGGALRTACQQDIAKLCAGEQKFRHCLKKNSDKLSEGCKTALAAHKKNKGDKADRKKDKDSE